MEQSGTSLRSLTTKLTTMEKTAKKLFNTDMELYDMWAKMNTESGKLEVSQGKVAGGFKITSDYLSSLAQEDADWCEWIAADEKALTWLIAFIDAWLKMDVDFGDSEFFQCTSSDGYALRYFERLGVETLDQLGVYIIESEHPASSFNAAVLREDIDYANQVARSMGLEFRLQRVG
jgi:hypothetical protein